MSSEEDKELNRLFDLLESTIDGDTIEATAAGDFINQIYEISNPKACFIRSIKKRFGSMFDPSFAYRLLYAHRFNDPESLKRDILQDGDESGIRYMGFLRQEYSRRRETAELVGLKTSARLRLFLWGLRTRWFRFHRNNKDIWFKR